MLFWPISWEVYCSLVFTLRNKDAYAVYALLVLSIHFDRIIIHYYNVLQYHSTMNYNITPAVTRHSIYPEIWTDPHSYASGTTIRTISAIDRDDQQGSCPRYVLSGLWSQGRSVGGICSKSLLSFRRLCSSLWSRRERVLRPAHTAALLAPRYLLFNHSGFLLLFREGRSQQFRKKSVSCCINQ